MTKREDATDETSDDDVFDLLDQARANDEQAEDPGKHENDEEGLSVLERAKLRLNKRMIEKVAEPPEKPKKQYVALTPEKQAEIAAIEKEQAEKKKQEEAERAERLEKSEEALDLLHAELKKDKKQRLQTKLDRIPRHHSKARLYRLLYGLAHAEGHRTQSLRKMEELFGIAHETIRRYLREFSQLGLVQQDQTNKMYYPILAAFDDELYKRCCKPIKKSTGDE